MGVVFNRVSFGASLVLCLGLASNVSAQQSGIFGSRSVGGASGLTGGSRTLTGSVGGGAGGGGLGQANATGATQQDMGAGAVTGSERFLRQNRQGSFVGADSGDATALLSSGLGGQGGGIGNLLRGLGQGQQNSQQPTNSSGQGQTARVYRTTRRVAFDFPAPTARTLNATLPTRLLALPRGLSRSIQARVTGQTVFLTGEVATDHDRDLAAQLVLLEPGVSKIENQIVVRDTRSPAR